jgi:hypothetical protein
MKTLSDKVRAIGHHLQMSTLNGLDEAVVPHLRQRIKGLPSPEKIAAMDHKQLETLAKVMDGIVFDMGRARLVRTVENDIRHRVQKGMPSYRAPVLGRSDNWYKKAIPTGLC